MTRSRRSVGHLSGREAVPEDLPFAAAAERNRLPIWEALQSRLPAAGRVLEIGAGSGQHAVYLAGRAPHLDWLATDLPQVLPGLAARIALEGGPNLGPPEPLDVRRGPWPAGPFAVAYAANVAHIMDWPTVKALFAGLAQVMSAGGLWFLYGPFKRDGTHTSAGNRAFDARLRAGGGGQGLRDLEALERLGAEHQLALLEDLAMPANNRLLVFRREPGPGARDEDDDDLNGDHA